MGVLLCLAPKPTAKAAICNVSTEDYVDMVLRSEGIKKYIPLYYLYASKDFSTGTKYTTISGASAVRWRSSLKDG